MMTSALQPTNDWGSKINEYTEDTNVSLTLYGTGLNYLLIV